MRRSDIMCCGRTNEKLARVNALLDELDDAAAHSCDDGEEIQLTILLAPLSRKN